MADVGMREGKLALLSGGPHHGRTVAWDGGETIRMYRDPEPVGISTGPPSNTFDIRACIDDYRYSHSSKRTGMLVFKHIDSARISGGR